MIKPFLLFLLIAIIHLAFAQIQIKGLVINAKTKQPLALVNIGVIINNHFQTMGLYEFVSDRYIYVILEPQFWAIDQHQKQNLQTGTFAHAKYWIRRTSQCSSA